MGTKLLIRIFIIVAFSFVLFSQTRIQVIDSLKTKLKLAEDDTNKVKIFSELCFNNYNIDPDEGIEYGQKGVELAKKLRWQKGESKCYFSLGVVYNFGKADLLKASDYYNKTLRISKKIEDSTGIAKALGNLAIVKRRQGEFDSSIELYLESINILRALDDKLGLAKSYTNLGILYQNLNENENALKYYNRSLALSNEFNDKISVANVKVNIAITLTRMDSLDKALSIITEAIEVFRAENLNEFIGRAYQSIARVYFEKKKYVEVLDLLDSAEYYKLKLGNTAKLGIIYANKGFAYLVIADSNFVSKEDINISGLKNDLYVKNAIKYLQKAYNIFDSAGVLKNNLETVGNLAKAFSKVKNYKRSSELQEQFIQLRDEQFNSEKAEIIARMKADQEIIDQKNEIALLKEKEALNKKKNFYVILTTSIVLILILIFLIISQYQKKESEGLLLNILPKKIADRLKKKENNIADDIKEATIIFIDMVDFTKKMHGKPADQIVKYLSGFFETIDSLVVKYKLEKIKTIGDGYMVASGVPNFDPNNKSNACNFALELLKVSEYPVRIGMDSGRVSAGIIGNMKFAYDVWGETVNMASRMESLGDTGKIQVTEEFAQSLMNDYKFQERGMIDIKGYGTVKTYFLES